MKLSCAFTALFIAVPNVEASSLRSAFNSYFGSLETDSAKAQILIPGVLHNFSPQDLDIIAATAKTSYANTYGKGGEQFLQSIQAQLHFDVPESLGVKQCHMCPPDDDVFATVLGQAKIILADIQVASRQCHMCPPDDDTLEELLAEEGVHDRFVQDFCHALTVSGSANLANAHKCSFTFLDKPGHNIAKEAMLDNSVAFITMNGLPHDLSNQDLHLIDNSAMEAYNDAFSYTMGFQLDSFNVRDVVEIPYQITQCHMCPPDDDAIADAYNNHRLGGGKVVFVDLHVRAEQCHMCPPDDDALALVGDANIQFLHSAFEKAFCDKLRNSGAANFANMDACSFDFMFAPAMTAADSTPSKKVKGEQCHMCPPDDDATMAEEEMD